MNLPKVQTDKLTETVIELRKPLLVVAMLWGLSLALMLASEIARAELRCDCSQVVDSCSATVSLDGMRVSIESDSNACSRVVYLIEGQPFAALVVGGSSELNWPGQPMRDPGIVVESCSICAETGAGAAAATDATANTDEASSDSTAQPIVKVMPSYPRDAWTNLIEGNVTVEFNVNSSGVVENIRVVEASNPIFVNNSIDAVSRFRYSPAMTAGEAQLASNVREQFNFRVLNGFDPVVNSKSL